MSKGAEAASRGSELGAQGGQNRCEEVAVRPAWVAWGGSEWPNKRDSHVGERGEIRHQVERHKPKRKMYSREYIMILWFLNHRHSGTLSCVFPHLSSTDIPFLSYPLKAKYMELMGKDKGYNLNHVYCQVKGWSKKNCEIFSNDFGKGF
jgi:hypothetical protein